MSVGNRRVDSLHKGLLGAHREIADALSTGCCEILQEKLQLFEGQLTSYFAIERDIASTINFPFSQHELNHQELFRNFQRTEKALLSLSRTSSVAEAVANCCFLRNCLLKHYKEESRQLKLELDMHFYDLTPG